jgi:hypothetical protein
MPSTEQTRQCEDALAMTPSGPLRRFDPFRPVDMLASFWSSAAVLPVSTGAGAAYRAVFMTIRRLVVGRQLTVRLDSGDINMTVTEFDSRLDLRGLAVGQLSDVRIAARDIEWDSNRFERGSLLMHNVHLRPSAPPVLVAAPVELSVDVPAEVIDHVFRFVAPRWAGDIGPDAKARLRLARRPALGHLEVEVHLDGNTVWLKPSGLAFMRKRWGLPERTPGYPIHLPELAHGLQVTGVTFAPDVVRVSGIIPEWRMEMSRKRLEEIIAQLSAAGRTLNLTRLTRALY